MDYHIRKILFFVMLVSFILIFTGCSGSGSDSERVESAVADAGGIQFGFVGSAIQLDASLSTGAARYHWTLRSTPTGSTARLTDFESVSPMFLADKPGSYVVQLVVMNSVNSTSKDFTVVEIAPMTTGGSKSASVHDGLTQSCQSCHNGLDATGKPGNHIEATDECVACHSTEAWQPNIAIDHNEILGTCSFCHDGVRAPGKPADHIETSAECNLCHNAGTTFTYAVTPQLGTFDDDEEHPPIGDAMCFDCHNNIIEEGKPTDHIPASDTCENCHVTTDWEDVAGGGTIAPEPDPVEIDEHPPIGDAMCFDCHNNVIEEGKPEDHIPASNTCENCHVTTDWDDVIGGSGSGGSITDDDDDEGDDEHPPIGDMACVECHNNIIEEGKEDDHILTTDLCEACHTTNDFEPAITVDHTQVIGVCSSCHDNEIAMGKPPGHIDTAAECDNCHSTNSWTPASGSGGGGNAGGGGGAGTVDHSGFTQATVCMNCHNGTLAMGKPAGHVTTSSDCDVCHVVTGWPIP